MKTHWKKLNNPDYLGAYSLGDNKELKVEILKVVREIVTSTGGKKEECTVAHLKNQKPIILNSTNCKMISKNFGTSFIEDWQNKHITLYIAKIKAFGEDNVECLRVKKEAQQKPKFTPEHNRWDGAIKALKDGSTTIEQIEQSFNLSKEDKTKLVDLAL